MDQQLTNSKQDNVLKIINESDPQDNKVLKTENSQERYPSIQNAYGNYEDRNLHGYNHESVMKDTRDSSLTNIRTELDDSNKVILQPSQGFATANRSINQLPLQSSYYSQFPSEQSISRKKSSYILTKRLLDQMNHNNAEYFNKHTTIQQNTDQMLHQNVVSKNSRSLQSRLPKYEK